MIGDECPRQDRQPEEIDHGEMNQVGGDGWTFRFDFFACSYATLGSMAGAPARVG